jgi:hypothetical protein
MLTRNILAAVLATTLAAPMAAQSVSQGEAQLAQTLGVQPGMYSLEQLARLEGLENDDSQTAAQTRQFILDNPKGPMAMANASGSANMGVGQGEAQLAASLGVEPGIYSLEQLTRLEGLENEDSVQAAQNREFIMANPEGPMAFEMSTEFNGVTMGEEQLARIVGVEPGLYSLDQLARLNRLQDEGTPTAQQNAQDILNNPQGPLAGS